MARAAVRAKQLEKAKAQPTKSRARGRKRRHSGGGNPNQELFFVKMRRGQKWLYGFLAVVFALTFVGVGVGSGTGGLQQLYSGLFGTGGNPVSKAQGEIKDTPAKGYRDLATAYETTSQNVLAAAALNKYLKLRKTDANSWAELGGLELTQAQKYTTQYSNAQQSAQLADPSAPFLPSGSLGTAVGTNVAYQDASQNASTKVSTLYTKAIKALNSSVTEYEHAVKNAPKNAIFYQELATAAENAGNTGVAIGALQTYLKLLPHSPLKKQIKAQIKSLKQSAAAAKASSKNAGSASSGSSGG
jgi:tetratricopeptide (TPR) repeat protein